MNGSRNTWNKVAPLLALVLGARPGMAQEGAPSAPPVTPLVPPVLALVEPWPADHPLQPALATVRADDLRDYERWLASDERQGRCAGEPGNDEAGDWIAQQFEEMGLAPLGSDGSFFQPFEFSVRGGERGLKATTRNVVGLWEGSDPELRSQVIVLGAHYDHVGTTSSRDAGRAGRPTATDTIWNGADDNGSGTSTLIEVAEAFAMGGVRPKRSLVFIAFSAEEQGLFGSAWWCANPTVPRENVVAMVNLDMVGRNADRPVEMAAVGSLQDDLWRRLVDASRPAAPDLALELKDHFLPDSDHASFIDAGIPATFFFSGMHDDYHRISDSWDKIEYERMAQIGRMATALLWNTANCAEPFRFAKPVFQPRGRGKRLGVQGDALADAARLAALGLPQEHGGYLVETVLPDGVGAKAGLVAGDVILSIGGKPISSDDPNVSLRRLIAGAAAKEDVAIVVLRGDEQVTLTARWE
ncbi:MAG: M20/M25/M40 family metallo-hydrolase [Planctomycetes bacterium]|nr:M20/M25/M40 family metallo-hydrolase [Planctomycetota bacterium]